MLGSEQIRAKSGSSGRNQAAASGIGQQRPESAGSEQIRPVAGEIGRRRAGIGQQGGGRNRGRPNLGQVEAEDNRARRD
jgi:hypothetical protein